MRTITADTVIAAAPHQVSCDLDGEAAVLNLKSGVYYGLDAVGASMWKLIQKGVTFSDICAAVTTEYNVDGERAEADARAFLGELMREGLIELMPAAPSA